MRAIRSSARHFSFCAACRFPRSAAHTGYIDQLRNSTFYMLYGAGPFGVVFRRISYLSGMIRPLPCLSRRRRIFYKSFTLPPAFAVESAVVLCYTEK